MDISIPNGCSSQQLFADAEEVLVLQTDLAGLETQFRDLYLRYANEVPNTHATTESMRNLWIEQTIQVKHPHFFTELDTKRARYKGLIAKGSLVRSAVEVLAMEQGIVSSVS